MNPSDRDNEQLRSAVAERVGWTSIRPNDDTTCGPPARPGVPGGDGRREAVSQSNTETLLALVERLREAGQRTHSYTYVNQVTGVILCPAAVGGTPYSECLCGKNEHNAAVDAAAKALVDKINNTNEDCCPGCGKLYGNTAKACNNPACNRDCLHGV